MASYKKGDWVQLKDPTQYTYRGENYPDYARRVGTAIGKVHSDHGDVLNVEWEGVVLHSTEGRAWGISSAAVVPVTLPPSKEELDEVYRILGVSSD